MRKVSDSGFKKEIWENIRIGFNQEFSLIYEIIKFKIAFITLKADYQIIKKLRNLNGFEWTIDIQLITISEEIWEVYLLYHKKIRKWKDISFPFYDKLYELYEERMIIGEFIISLGKSISKYISSY
jgi:hypothetical protein